MAHAQKFDCSICANTCSISKQVTCSACGFDTCRSCFQTWVTSTEKDPECMSCHEPFTWDKLNESTTKTFMNNDYKRHRRNVLLDREKTLIPSTMPLVERERQIREMNKVLSDITARRNELRKQLAQLDRLYRDTYRQQSLIRHGEGASTTKKTYTVKCPVDNCKGFLDEKKFCSLCENTICTRCMEVKTDGHECDEGKVATVEMIKAQSKPCPSCATRIQKTHGCSQMWCPECKVFFNWNSGEIITRGPLHNPEYIEWMRRTGGTVRRELGDQYCGGMPIIFVSAAALADAKKLCNTDLTSVVRHITDLTRHVNHIGDAEMRRYPIRPLDQINQSTRVKFLMNDITEEEFAKELQQAERNNNYNNEIRSALTLVNEVVSDKLRELLSPTEIANNRGTVMKSAKAAVKMCEMFNHVTLPQLEEFRTYINTTFVRIGKRYNRVPKVANNRFNIY